MSSGIIRCGPWFQRDCLESVSSKQVCLTTTLVLPLSEGGRPLEVFGHAKSRSGVRACYPIVRVLSGGTGISAVTLHSKGSQQLGKAVQVGEPLQEEGKVFRNSMDKHKSLMSSLPPFTFPQVPGVVLFFLLC